MNRVLKVLDAVGKEETIVRSGSVRMLIGRVIQKRSLPYVRGILAKFRSTMF